MNTHQTGRKSLQLDGIPATSVEGVSGLVGKGLVRLCQNCIELRRLIRSWVKKEYGCKRHKSRNQNKGNRYSLITLYAETILQDESMPRRRAICEN
jgi:hypothetical protein